MEEEKIQQESQIQKKVTPKDATALYMENRIGLMNSLDEYELLKKTIESIILGCSLLDVKDPLKKEAEDTIIKKENYLPMRKMEFTSDNLYSISTSGEQSSGIIKVRASEIERGERCLLNQQSTSILLRLRLLDSKIYSRLVERNIIPMYGMKHMLSKQLKEEIEHGISSR